MNSTDKQYLLALICVKLGKKIGKNKLPVFYEIVNTELPREIFEVALEVSRWRKDLEYYYDILRKIKDTNEKQEDRWVSKEPESIKSLLKSIKL